MNPAQRARRVCLGEFERSSVFRLRCAGTPWIKASRSQQGNCVEMRRHGGAVEVRDTKDDGTGPVLRFTPAEWDAWLDGAKNGEFDHLS